MAYVNIQYPGSIQCVFLKFTKITDWIKYLFLFRYSETLSHQSEQKSEEKKQFSVLMVITFGTYQSRTEQRKR